jgi:hypothetical protein
MFTPTKYFTDQYPALLNGKEVGYGVMSETIYSPVELGFYGGTEQLTRRKFGILECRTNGHFQAFSEIFHLDRLIPSLLQSCQYEGKLFTSDGLLVDCTCYVQLRSFKINVLEESTIWADLSMEEFVPSE